MTDYTGQQLGNYRLMHLLGSGGYADVYLGRHMYLDTHQAAIKVLHTHMTREDIEHFHFEARVLAHVVHPHIVRLLDYHIEGQTPFLVMEYAPGGSLRHHHPQGTKLPLSTIVSYVSQIADALQHAHTLKLVHRDIKPENMLCGRRNEVLLSDFGIVTLTCSTRSQSLEQVVGSPAYMAPEQFRGRPRRASDQYALGIVVYEWLCGDVPFHGSLTQLANQHLFSLPPSLREQGLMLPHGVEQVMRKALAKHPKERFASVQEFAQTLIFTLQRAL